MHHSGTVHIMSGVIIKVVLSSYNTHTTTKKRDLKIRSKNLSAYVQSRSVYYVYLTSLWSAPHAVTSA
jgi:hypothetical protein